MFDTRSGHYLSPYVALLLSGGGLVGASSSLVSTPGASPTLCVRSRLLRPMSPDPTPAGSTETLVASPVPRPSWRVHLSRLGPRIVRPVPRPDARHTPWGGPTGDLGRPTHLLPSPRLSPSRLFPEPTSPVTGVSVYPLTPVLSTPSVGWGYDPSPAHPCLGCPDGGSLPGSGWVGRRGPGRGFRAPEGPGRSRGTVVSHSPVTYGVLLASASGPRGR